MIKLQCGLFFDTIFTINRATGRYHFAFYFTFLNGNPNPSIKIKGGYMTLIHKEKVRKKKFISSLSPGG